MGFSSNAVYKNAGYKFGRWRDVSILEKQLFPLCPDPPEPVTVSTLDPEFISREMKKSEAFVLRTNS